MQLPGYPPREDRMFEQISNLITVLNEAGALERSEVVTALSEFARCLEDVDYRSQMFGELSLKLAALRKFDDAERAARSVENTERSEFLRRVADIEASNHELVRALRVYLEAREATSLHRFPTRRAQALSEIASSLEATAQKDIALQTWRTAIDLATPAQNAKGTDGPEAAGVLVSAVESFCKAGRSEEAKAIAEGIIFETLREKALQVIGRAAGRP